MSEMSVKEWFLAIWITLIYLPVVLLGFPMPVGLDRGKAARDVEKQRRYLY